jgi:hypothetical protein
MYLSGRITKPEFLLSLDYTFGTSYLDIGEQNYTDTTCMPLAESNYWSVAGKENLLLKVASSTIYTDDISYVILDSGTSLMYFSEMLLTRVITELSMSKSVYTISGFYAIQCKGVSEIRNITVKLGAHVAVIEP